MVVSFSGIPLYRHFKFEPYNELYITTVQRKWDLTIRKEEPPLKKQGLPLLSLSLFVVC